MADTPEPPPKRRPGRPRVPENEQGSCVSIWVRPKDHDKLIALAKRHELSVSAMVRDLLHLRLK